MACLERPGTLAPALLAHVLVQHVHFGLCDRPEPHAITAIVQEDVLVFLPQPVLDVVDDARMHVVHVLRKPEPFPVY